MGPDMFGSASSVLSSFGMRCIVNNIRHFLTFDLGKGGHCQFQHFDCTLVYYITNIEHIMFTISKMLTSNI